LAKKELLAAVRAAHKAGTTDPVSYIEAALRKYPGASRPEHILSWGLAAQSPGCDQNQAVAAELGASARQARVPYSAGACNPGTYRSGEQTKGIHMSNAAPQ
jgi:hypothetical protein